jgi:hypothetical protein
MIPSSMNHTGTIMIIDSEGLSDPTSSKNFSTISKIFSLTTLLSSSITIHSFRIFFLEDYDKLAAVGALAHMLGVDAVTRNKGEQLEREEDVHELLPNLNFMITNAGLMKQSPGMQNKSFDISEKLEEVLSNHQLKDVPAALRYLFPKRKMFGGAVAREEEVGRLNELNNMPGVPDYVFSKSVVAIWKQMLEGMKAKKFAGQEIDGSKLRFLVNTMHDTTTKADGLFTDSLTLGALNTHLKDTEWNKITQIINQTKAGLKLNLIEGLNQLTEKRVVLARVCESKIIELQKRASYIAADDLKWLRMATAQEIDKTFQDLSQFLANLTTFEWHEGEYGACQCGTGTGTRTGTAERKVECRRVYDKKAVEDYKCKEGKPNVTKSCYAENYSWEKGEWSNCNGTCPGVREQEVICMQCGKNKKYDDECKHLPRPRTPIQSCEVLFLPSSSLANF